MGCGGCGGGVSPKTIQRAATKAIPMRTKQIRPIAPANSQKIVRSPTVLKAKVRAAGTKSCPKCGASVRTIMAGSGRKKRLLCSACGTQFVR